MPTKSKKTDEEKQELKDRLDKAQATILQLEKAVKELTNKTNRLTNAIVERFIAENKDANCKNVTYVWNADNAY